MKRYLFEYWVCFDIKPNLYFKYNFKGVWVCISNVKKSEFFFEVLFKKRKRKVKIKILNFFFFLTI